MRHPILSLMVVLMTAACASRPQVSLEDRILPFGCNDIVVVGRVQNGSFELDKSEDDLIGHGWILATIKVRKVVKGADIPPILPVKYFAHTYMRQDSDFMLVLERAHSGVYEIKTGQLMRLRPKLASSCD